MKNFSLSFLLICIFLTPSFAQGPAARAEAKIGQVRSQYGLMGEGTLAVVMDRGVDYRHPDFIDENGKTRIAYIYDLYDNSGANASNNPYGKGTIFTEEQINASLEQGGDPITNDIYGHGTATTGILAGNGSAIANTNLYEGVAPKARIISIVVTKDFVPPFGNNPGRQGQFDPNLLPTAFAFAEDKIEELGLPSVTLLNIGSIGSPTDGSIAFCETVDAFVAKGNTFVCGVGDDGGQDNSVMEMLERNTTTTFEIQKGEAGNLRFTAWYDDAARCELTIERPNGSIEGPFAPPSGPNDAKDQFPDQLWIYHRGANVEFDQARSNLRQLLIDMGGEAGTYKVNLRTTQVGNDAKIYAMLNPSRFNNNNKFLNFSQAAGSINAYSSCLGTLSPSDYVANISYRDVNGTNRTRSGEGNVGELWLGASKGPTMDGRLGTDLAATGELAVGAYSQDSYYGAFAFNEMENSNGFYGIQNAVSGAAPIVAGVIALMLEADLNLTPEEIKTILQETARSDNFTGDTPNAAWGHGKLDALAAVEKVLNPTNIQNHKHELLGLRIGPNPFLDQLFMELVDPQHQTIDASILTMEGKTVWEDKIVESKTISLEHLSAGMYIMKVSSQLGREEHKLLKID